MGCINVYKCSRYIEPRIRRFAKPKWLRDRRFLAITSNAIYTYDRHLESCREQLISIFLFLFFFLNIRFTIMIINHSRTLYGLSLHSVEYFYFYIWKHIIVIHRSEEMYFLSLQITRFDNLRLSFIRYMFFALFFWRL